MTSILAQLLAATPPPPADLDVDALLAAFHAMVTQRQPLLEGLTELVAHDAAERTQLRELHDRNEQWRIALSSAHGRVIDHRVGTTKMRAYAPSTSTTENR